MEYFLLNASNPSHLSKMVNDKIKDGWELYGSPGIIVNGMSLYSYQAIVKYDVSDKRDNKINSILNGIV